MRFSRLATTTLALAVAGVTMLTATPGVAQSVPQQQPQMPDSVRELLSEMQQIQEQLGQIQQQALAQNPDLQQKQENLQKTVEKAMHEENPQIDKRLDRMAKLEQEFRAAQEQKDTQKVQSLMQEAQQIQQELQQTQARVVKRKDVAQQIEQFEADMILAMKEVDPKTEQLIARMEELSAQLQPS